MSGASIGLDIGSSAVRAAELTRTRRGLSLRRFAQIGLPLGAVVGGEIRDPGAVATALRRLWSEAGFGARNVVLAASGPRVIVRQAQVVAMSEGDFRSALAFQAMDLIPLPVDDALLDFVILPAAPGVGKASDRMDILLAAAHRAVVESQLRVLREASLRAVAIDPAPTAAIRATERASFGTGATVAMVDLGAELTVIVVREEGRVRFSRILRTGGGDLTQRLATRLAVPAAEAESFKRRPADDGAHDVVLATDLDPLVSEVEGSLSFFSDQMGAERIHGVLLTGGGSRSPELVAQLIRRLHWPVSVVDAFEGLDCADLVLDPDDRDAGASMGLLAIGAAEWAFDQPSRRLSLLPRELARAAVARRQLVAAAVGVAVVAAGLTGLTLERSHQTAAVKAQTAAVTVTNAATQAGITHLAPLSAVISAVQARLARLTADESDDIAWSSLLQEIAAAMPVGTKLTSYAVSDAQSAGGVATSAAGVATVLGTVTMSVQAHGTEDQVAVWLRAFAHLPGLSTVWVPSGSATAGLVTFSSTAVLTTGVPLVERANGSSS